MYDVVKFFFFFFDMDVVKKLKGEDLTKVIEGHGFVIININFLFHPSLHVFIGIYYNRCEFFDKYQ
jgi:hypothetical protein